MAKDETQKRIDWIKNFTHEVTVLRAQTVKILDLITFAKDNEFVFTDTDFESAGTEHLDSALLTKGLGASAEILKFANGDGTAVSADYIKTIRQIATS